MRVLVIAPQPFFAERGTPIAVRHLVETLCADGHRVDLLTYPFGKSVEVEGLSIHRCGRFPGIRRVGIGFSLGKILLDLMLMLKLFRMAKPGRYDAVHAVEESIYLALLLRRRHRTDVVYDMDSSLADQLADGHALFRVVQPLLARIEQWAIRSADVVAPMCQVLADYAADVRDTEDPVVLHDVPLGNGSSARVHERPPSDGPLEHPRSDGRKRPRAGASERPTSDASERPPSDASEHRSLALYVGNLESYQGIDLLVDAVGHLPVDAPVSVRVVGGPMSEVERFRSIVDQRGLGDRIEFVGPRPVKQLHSLLAGADILLSPRTKGNNTPLKIYSYMESGRAILATRLSTHTQVLDDSTALLVDASPEAYARGLVRLVDDEELRSTLSASAQLRVRRSYSPWSFTRRVRDIYAPARASGRAQLVPSWHASGAWGGVDRRSRGDRRSGSDRRSVPRAGQDRRVGDRRSFAYA